MYKNQYLINNTKAEIHEGLIYTSFNNLNIYSHPSLNVSTAKYLFSEVLLLGYIINPLKPKESDDDIARNLAKTCDSKESLFKELQELSGRFVLLYKNESAFIALNDACALKQLYYAFIDKDIILTSSLRMFLDLYGNDLQTTKDKMGFINLKEYEQNEHTWFGDKSIENRLMKVLPNHYLDINNNKVFRIPVYFEELVNESNIIEYSSEVLRGSMAAITKRYQVIQPITAGWDSRTLLAASKDCLHDIQFYVIDLSSDGKLLPDVWVPQKLSRKLGFDFQVIKLKGPSDEFLKIFKREHLFPRLQYVSEIEYLYNKYSDIKTVRVSGVAGATLKSVYGYTNFNIDADKLSQLTYYLRKSNFVKDEIDCWIRDAKNYSKEYGIQLLDIFHWENKVGNWGALYFFEQDIAIEDFCPHANRNLLVSILRIDPRKRAKPECLLIKDIIKYLWKDTLSEPINPVGLIKSIRRKFHKYAMLKYLYLRTQSAIICDSSIKTTN